MNGCFRLNLPYHPTFVSKINVKSFQLFFQTRCISHMLKFFTSGLVFTSALSLSIENKLDVIRSISKWDLIRGILMMVKSKWGETRCIINMICAPNKRHYNTSCTSPPARSAPSSISHPYFVFVFFDSLLLLTFCTIILPSKFWGLYSSTQI